MKPKSDPNAPRRGLLWFGTITTAILMILLALAFNEKGWSPFDVGFIAVCAAILVGLLLTLINAKRFWWAMRLVTFIIFVLSFWDVLEESLIHRHGTLIGDSGALSVFNALRAFLIFGLPSLLYTLWGSAWGKLGTANPQNVSKADVRVFRLAVYGRWIFLALTLIVVIVATANLFT